MIGGYSALTVDCEVYPNFPMIGTRDTTTQIPRQFSNSGIGESFAIFREWFYDVRHDYLWIGFNTVGYDNWIIRAILMGMDDPDEIYKVSQAVIQNNDDFRNKLDTADGEFSVDLLAMFGGSKTAKIGSLKELAIKTGYPHLQELPFPFDKPLTFEEMQEVARYNIKDLEVTARVAEIASGDIAVRVAMTEHFGVSMLHKHKPGIAEAAMAKRLFGDERKSYPTTKSWSLPGTELTKGFYFTDPNFQELRERMSAWQLNYRIVDTNEDGKPAKSLERTPFSESVKSGNLTLTIGVGGLHSVDEPALYEADEQYRILEFDVSSYYPALVCNYQLVPAHLPKHLFLREYNNLRQMRLTAKANGDVALAEGLKIATNSIFGKMGTAYGWLIDPTAAVKITVIGQLTLIAFIDLILESQAAEVISVNTDAIMMRVKRDVADAVTDACNQLARHYDLALSWTEYVKVARHHVNSYFAVKLDGTSKGRGDYYYNFRDLEKKATNAICVEAAQLYFQHGTPVEDTVRSCRDILMFINYFKCSKGWVITDPSGAEHGTIARWYHSPKGVHLDKKNRLSGKVIQQVESGAMLIPDLPDVFPDDVDFEHYIKVANKLVSNITEPELKFSSNLPLAELSKAQRSQHDQNHACKEASPATCAGIDLAQAHTDYAAVIKGNRHDTMKHLLVRLWMAARGGMTQGDLSWVAKELDASDGYFRGNKRLDNMVEWVARVISPFPMPRTTEEHVTRAMTWAREHVEVLKRKRTMQHKNLLCSTFVNGEAVRKYGKTRDEFKLACHICACIIKNESDAGEGFVVQVINEIRESYNQEP